MEYATNHEKILMKTPVLILIFNRPDLTSKLLSVLNKIKPTSVYVCGDGARTSVRTDVENVERTRSLISEIDWDCEVNTLYRENNLGCKESVSTGIDWFFDNVNEGIILEDDCIPDISFFKYCEEMLSKYRDDQRIMHISGLNFLTKKQTINDPEEDSYHFSKYPAVWGWATWKRAWGLYDSDISDWQNVRRNKDYYSMCFNRNEALVRKQQFDSVFSGEIDTWDYQWVYCVGMNHGLSITPNINLISNIGFDSNATHTFTPDNRSFLPSYEMIFPLKHPDNIVADYLCDYREYIEHIHKYYWFMALIRLLKRYGLYEYAYKIKSRLKSLFLHLLRG
jgi:hypothetical protein